MSYLSSSHRDLAESQHSHLMGRFTNLRFDQRMLAIAASLALGVTSAALAWTGTSSDRVYFCVVYPSRDLQCFDKQNRPFQMTRHHWQQWQADGKPTPIIANIKVGNPQGLVPATNPYKTAWAFSAFLGFAVAGWMLRHLQHEEAQLAPLEAIAQQQQQAVADMSARVAVVEAYREVAIKQAELEADVELVRHEHLVRLGQAELLGETEIEIARLEAEEIKFDAQTAGLTDEQKHEYIEFLKKAETPYLTGTQTLETTIDPSTKVTGSGVQPAITQQPGDSPLLIKDVARLMANRLIDEKNGGTVLVVAPSGVGKTNLLKQAIVYANDIKDLDFLVLTGKTQETYCGLEKHPDDYLESEVSPGDIPLFLGRIKRRLTTAPGFPTVFIADEYNNTLAALESHDRLSKADPIQPLVSDDMYSLATKGRSKLCSAWMTSHESLVDALGFSKQLRMSIPQVYLGRAHLMGMIEYMLLDGNGLHTCPEKRELAELFRQVRPAYARDKDKVLALTNIEGLWELVELPFYPDKQPEIQRGALNQSTAEILADDILLTPPVTPEMMGNRDRQRLEFLLNLPDEVSAPVEPDSGDLSDRQKAILQYAAEKEGWITPSELQANVRQCRGIASKEIIADFEVLSANGFGISDKSGKTTKWKYTL